MRVGYHKNFVKRVIVESMYNFNQRIVALESLDDSELLSVTSLNSQNRLKECIYVLQENAVLLKLVNTEGSLKTPQKMEIIARFDYSDHNL